MRINIKKSNTLMKNVIYNLNRIGVKTNFKNLELIKIHKYNFSYDIDLLIKFKDYNIKFKVYYDSNTNFYYTVIKTGKIVSLKELNRVDFLELLFLIMSN